MDFDFFTHFGATKELYSTLIISHSSERYLYQVGNVQLHIKKLSRGPDPRNGQEKDGNLR